VLGLPALAGAADAEPPRRPSYWEAERRRIFAAGVLGAGISGYGELNVGHGRPFWSWFGYQGWVLANKWAVMGSSGLKLALPIVSLSVAHRVTRSHAHGPLPLEPGFTTAELEGVSQRRPYASLDAEVAGTLPLPHLLLLPTLGAHYSLGQGEPLLLYDELDRVIFAPPWVSYVKLAALFTWGPARRYRVGAQGEQLWVGRSQGITRVGPAVSIQLTPHFEARALLALAVRTPDDLDVLDGSGSSLTLRYRWASGESKPGW
jgi:hypothetical protein